MKFIKTFIFFLARWSGFFRLQSFFGRNDCYLIGYHGFAPVDVAHGTLFRHITVTPDDFEKQLVALVSYGHTFVRMSELDDACAKGIMRPTVIYFDDGLQSAFDNAVPILKKYNASGTFFITTKFADRETMPWSSALRASLEKQGKSEEEITHLIASIKKMGRVDRENALAPYALQTVAREVLQTNALYMNWDAIRELSRQQHEIGSHGVSHVKLSECTDQELQSELAESAARIESELGKPISSISYPHARFDERVLRVARDTGYTHGVGFQIGPTTKLECAETPLALRHIDPPLNGTISEFLFRLYHRG